MDLRICIVNYNTRELLDRCLASLLRYPPPGEYEIVVVDNASQDGSVEMLREKYPQVRVIACAQNIGYAAGNNLALQDCQARYALILNSDIEVFPKALTRLQEFMDTHPQAGMCGARLILPDGSIQPSCATDLSLRKFATQQLLLDRTGLAKYTFGEYWLDVSRVTEPIEVEQLTGACMYCRRAAIQEVGFMDEGYWMYVEDTDYCLRFRKAGWKLYYVPQALMRHELGGSSKTARADMIAAYNHSAVRYFRLHQGRGAAWAARGLGLAGVSLRLLIWLAATLGTLGLVPRYRRQATLFLKAWALTLWPRSLKKPSQNFNTKLR